MDHSLAELVVARATRPTSPLHGEQHWKAVAWAGYGLARADDACDAELVLLFALLHDSQRHNEGSDPEHGLRAAEFAERLGSEGVLRLDGRRLALLMDACVRHDRGETSDDPTIGACWDADRLNLWRVHTTPLPALLSTATGRDPALIDEAASFHGRPYTWEALFADFAVLGAR